MKNSNDSIWNRTRDLPACSAVPQPTTPPCTPLSGMKRPVMGHIDIAVSETPTFPIFAAEEVVWRLCPSHSRPASGGREEMPR
jgi:hypothetical protein